MNKDAIEMKLNVVKLLFDFDSNGCYSSLTWFKQLLRKFVYDFALLDGNGLTCLIFKNIHFKHHYRMNKTHLEGFLLNSGNR